MMRKPLHDTHLIPDQHFPNIFIVSPINYTEGEYDLSSGLET